MKVLRTKNGNILIASNLVFIFKEIELLINGLTNYYINAVDVNGKKYCLVDEIIEGNVDKDLKNIVNYLTNEGD